MEDEVINVESEDDQDAQEMDEIESVSKNDDEMPTDDLELQDVQLFTQSEASNERNDEFYTKDKPFQCKTCLKRFSMPSKLKLHEMIHTDERPNQCQVCQKSFREKGKLNTHSCTTKVETQSRPKMTYTQLIAEALLNAKDKSLRLSEIYNAIVDRYPYYNLKDQGWQNSIRHNLSKYKGQYFMLLGKSVIGKGGIWKLLPEGEEYLKKGDKRKQ